LKKIRTKKLQGEVKKKEAGNGECIETAAGQKDALNNLGTEKRILFAGEIIYLNKGGWQ